MTAEEAAEEDGGKVKKENKNKNKNKSQNEDDEEQTPRPAQLRSADAVQQQVAVETGKALAAGLLAGAEAKTNKLYDKLEKKV